jgi:hypothetical protein
MDPHTNEISEESIHILSHGETIANSGLYTILSWRNIGYTHPCSEASDDHIAIPNRTCVVDRQNAVQWNYLSLGTNTSYSWHLFLMFDDDSIF